MKKPQVIAVLILALLSFTSIAYSQEARVVVENAKTSTDAEPLVLIKWYSKELMYEEGVNIYRRVEGSLSWEKINTAPVIRKQQVSAAALAADEDLGVFVDVVRESKKEDLQDEMFFFNLIVKSFQSNVFSDFLGIYYEDKTARSGVNYEYKVSKIKAGRELPIATSQPIRAGLFTPSDPIREIKVFQKQKLIGINWIHEEERFYAVNVYRRASNESEAIKLNTQPIMLSQVVDSLGKLSYPDPMFSENRNIREGESYFYQLAGMGFFGNETRLSDPVEVSFKDITPPPAPKNLEAKADSMKVHLKWENVPVEDLKGMNIHRSMHSEGPFEIINTQQLTLSEFIYTDSLTIPGPYYYFISAVDNANNEAHSNLMFVEVQDVIPPASPEQLTIKADTGTMSLKWKMGVEPDLAGYYIYRTVDANNKKHYVLINAEPLKADHFEQKLPKNVKNKFFYFVVAVDTSYNRSRPSSFVSAKMPDILAPEKPFIKDISYADGNVVVEWIPNVDSDLLGYHVYRADTSKNFSQVNINMLSRGTFRYVDRGTQPNTDYYYHIVAFDSVMNASPQSKVAYARRVVKDSVAQARVALKVKNNKKKKHSQLHWDVKTEAPILGYVVYRGEAENMLLPITGLIKAKNFVDKKNDADGKKAHYYQVRAYSGETVMYSPVIR